MKLLVLTSFWVLSFLPIFSQIETDFHLANSVYQSENYESAWEMYTEIIESGDSSYLFHSYYMRAYCKYKLEKYNDAILDIEKSLEIPGKSKVAKRIKGNSNWLYSRTLEHLDKPNESLGRLKKASNYIESSLLYSTISILEFELGFFEEALNSSSISIQLDPKNAYAYNNRALIFLHFKKLEKAKKDVRKSIELNDRNPYAFKHRAMIYIAEEKFELACKDLKTAENLGYATFQNEIDSDHVSNLIKLHCSNEKK